MVDKQINNSPELNFVKERRLTMSESVYKVIELVGSSSTSWEDAAKNAVETAGKTLKDLRIAEITQMDMKIENGKVTAYRARVKLSFKYKSSN
jgi:flavin-binding protein dodecin